MRWIVFSRVVDNFGDIGFAWRLARDLGARGEDVRLAVDDPSALAWMAPRGATRVEVVSWAAGAAAPADVRVETFGCGLPEPAGAAASAPCVDVNVEHLSAEGYVERAHGKPSPRFDVAGRPRPLWFFYPGFTAATGGLLREDRLLERRDRFGDGRAWLHRLGIERAPEERCVSLFCYRHPRLDDWLDLLGEQPTLLLLTAGAATELAATALGPGLRRRGLRAVPLPWLEQDDFDHLLWSCDLNFVRGEDSLVRAIWAGAPFVWQLYAQDDGAHGAKLEAFLDTLLGPSAAEAPALRDLFAAWNGLPAHHPPCQAFAAVDRAAWSACVRALRTRCAAQADLTGALLGFVASKR